MTDLRKAAEMALEALETFKLAQNPIVPQSIYVLRQALAQPEQEPQRPVKSYTNGEPQYATDDRYTKPQNVYTSEERVHESDKSIHDLRAAAEMALVALDHTARSAVEQYVIEQQVVTFLKQALAQPEQEPYCWVQSKLVQGKFYKEKPRRIHTIPLYTAPPSKPWVSLSDEQISHVWHKDLWKSPSPHHDFARAIEAKLKELNHG